MLLVNKNNFFQQQSRSSYLANLGARINTSLLFYFFNPMFSIAFLILRHKNKKQFFGFYKNEHQFFLRPLASYEWRSRSCIKTLALSAQSAVTTKKASYPVCNIHLTATKTNFFVSVAHAKTRHVFVSFSTGALGFTGPQKRSYISCWSLGDVVRRYIRGFIGFRHMYYHIIFHGFFMRRRYLGFLRGFKRRFYLRRNIFITDMRSSFLQLYNGTRASHFARTGRRRRIFF